jgi:hypothetical protein
MEFTKYIAELYGVNAARRAKEHKLRAMVNENGRILGATAAKNEFAAAANAPPHVSAPFLVPGLYTQQGYPSAQRYQQPPPDGMQHPSYYAQQQGTTNTYPHQGHQPQFAGNMPLNQPMVGNNFLQNRGMQQPSPAQQPQQPPEQQQDNQQQAWMNPQAQALHASGQLGVGQQMPPPGIGSGGGFPPG